ncbi:hypothetical protein JCM8547_003207 [Rhodosporidiobolus lusitaniae]
MHTAFARLSQLSAHLVCNSSSRAMSSATAAAIAKGPDTLQKPGLVFLTAQTPNGNKVIYLAEELKAIGAITGYEVVPTSFAKNEQKSEWFEAVNPNGRIPALIDNRSGKKPINVWESASILLYLTKTYDTKGEFWFPNDEDLQTELLNWLFFLTGGVGPMQGQANHFFRYAPEQIEYGITRYQNETKRLYQVYEDHLSGKKDGIKKDWLVGGKYTIADQATQPWIRFSDWAGVSLEPFPNVQAWVDRIEERPATQAALKVPEQDMKTKIKSDPELEKKIQEESSKWVQAGNKK